MKLKIDASNKDDVARIAYNLPLRDDGTPDPDDEREAGIHLAFLIIHNDDGSRFYSSPADVNITSDKVFLKIWEFTYSYFKGYEDE